MLFKNEYPVEHSYFREAILKMLQCEDTDEEDRALLTRAMARVDEVSVFSKCRCGQPGCATFRFVDYKQAGYNGSIQIDTDQQTIIVTGP